MKTRNSATQLQLRPAPTLIRAVSFEAVTFFDPEQKKQVIILYSLGQDGIVREFNGGVWKPFPILKE